MGETISRAIQWSSDADKLENSPLNNDILTEILLFTEDFDDRYPQEARIQFREPLRWKTSIEAADLTSDIYDTKGELAVSLECDDNGSPLLQLSPPDITVHSFHYLSNLLQLTKDKKMKEIQACLEGNREPIKKIFGPISPTTQEDKLFNILHQLDEKLFSIAVKPITGEGRLSPAAVNTEVDLLKRFYGTGEDRVLKSVSYTSDYIFSNGCRSPPWRQMDGEICSLIIETCDTEPALFITCSTSGVFFDESIRGEEGVDYHMKKSVLYEDIITMLKNLSPHFAAAANEQINILK